MAVSPLTSLEDDDDDVDDGNAVDGAGGVDLTGGSSSGGGKKSPSFVDDDEESNDADDDESSWSSLVPVVVSSEVTMCVWNTSSKKESLDAVFYHGYSMVRSGVFFYLKRCKLDRENLLRILFYVCLSSDASHPGRK